MKINGEMMEKLSIKAYAVKHKLSIFNVMKMVKSSKLKSMVIEENGKEITYIILDTETEKEVQESIVPLSERESATLHKELRELRAELQQLKSEVEKLKKSIF
jgi:uncharacterized protein YlxW (UPF0749 family)